MSESSPQSFLNLLTKSGIISDDRLREEIAWLSSHFSESDLKLETLTQHLLDKELLTQWHLDKLLAGKYRGFILGKYKLLRLLGTGGMSSVYLAEHRLSGQRRAIKVLPRKRVSDKSYLDRFYLEARAAASLNHPNIVRIYDICNEADTHYMVMEFVQGQDLYERVKAKGPLPIEEAVDYCIQAAEGLSHAHKKELVHRDIKPANLLMTEGGVIKILDLGLALVNQEESESLTLLYNEKVMGTADYLSPEQAVNSHLVNHQADIYSLGCTLYFLLSGHPPFPKGTLAQRIAMHQMQEPADIRESRTDCPDSLAAICHQMMKKKPEFRYQNCIDLKAELLGWLETGRQLGIGLLPGVLENSRSTVDEADAHPTEPIVIDTTPVESPRTSSKKFGRLSSKKLLKGQSDKTKLSNKTRLSDKTRSSSKSISSLRLPPDPHPKWLLPALVGTLFIILLIIFYFAR